MLDLFRRFVLGLFGEAQMIFFGWRICEGKTEQRGEILSICTVGRNSSGHSVRGKAGSVPAFSDGER